MTAKSGAPKSQQSGKVDRARRKLVKLIAAGGAVTCLVSGGADSTCLWLVLRDLGYAKIHRIKADHYYTNVAALRGEVET